MSGDGITVDGREIPEAELDERFDTPGGPGGQHANRTETAVTLRFYINGSSLPEPMKVKLIARLGDVVEVKAADSRSQAMNRETARERLTTKIEAALIDPKPRRKTRPTRRAREQRLTAKKARSELKRFRRAPDNGDR